MSDTKQLLTHSRIQCFKTCRRKHEYSYEIGLRRIDDTRALRMGSAFHDGIANLGTGNGLQAAADAIRTHYSAMPEQFDPYEWAMECETILRLVCAYEWRWQADPLVNVATEISFQLPLVNPDTGRPTPSFDLAGKIDAIISLVQLPNGRLAVKESKTVSEDLGQHSPLWRRLRIDHQISLYVHAARQMGYAVDTVLYDVTRKPSIAPTPLPITDSDGVKVVLDADGLRVKNTSNKSWRQTGDKEKGYVLQTRPMTTEEWGLKLVADIVSRPDFYFSRTEIPRLDQDIDEYRHEIWEVQLAIREAQRLGRWYRTVSKECQYCQYFEPCSTNYNLSAGPPLGFEIVKDIHPELKGNENEQRSATQTSSPATDNQAAAERREPATVE